MERRNLPNNQAKGTTRRRKKNKRIKSQKRWINRKIALRKNHKNKNQKNLKSLKK